MRLASVWTGEGGIEYVGGFLPPAHPLPFPFLYVSDVIVTVQQEVLLRRLLLGSGQSLVVRRWCETWAGCLPLPQCSRSTGLSQLGTPILQTLFLLSRADLRLQRGLVQLPQLLG